MVVSSSRCKRLPEGKPHKVPWFPFKFDLYFIGNHQSISFQEPKLHRYLSYIIKPYNDPENPMDDYLRTPADGNARLIVDFSHEHMHL